MLQLVYGIAGTGKTTHVLNALKDDARQGRACIFLVPEQFSSTAEAMVYRHLGDALSGRVEVLSFARLAERILKSTGSLNRPVLTDAGRVVFVRRALDAIGGELAVFARQRRSTAFCSLCAQTLSELKIAGAQPQQLRAIAAEKNDAKLAEIALIFEAYEAAIEGAAVDPEDKLTLAAARAEQGYLDGKSCYIDGFDGFTAPEYGLLEKLLAACSAVVVSLCCDDLYRGEAGVAVFHPVRRVAQRLMRMAQKLAVPVGTPLELDGVKRTSDAALLAVNRLLALDERPEGGRLNANRAGGEEAPSGFDTMAVSATAEDGRGAVAKAPPKGGLYLTPAPDEWAEVGLAAAEMHRLARQGVPYSRMALVCREIDRYEVPVRRQFERYEIPVFLDASGTIEYTAPVVFIRAALALLRQGLVSRPILALLKSGLCPYSEMELAALENYVYTWNPKAEDWRRPFERHPEGFLKRMDAQAEEQLRLAEGVRAAAIPELEYFIQKSKKNNAAALSKQLYQLMDRFGAAACCEQTAQRLEAGGEPALAQQARRAWDLAMGLLDQMVALVGAEQLTPDEYDELLLILVRSTEFGQTPQTMECVSFTSADRMRLDDIDHCFVVGLNEGSFPKQVGYSGLLTHLDRDALVAGGIEMPGSFENRSLMEEMFFYRALTAAGRALYLSWPARQGAENKAMSAALEPVREVLAPPELALPDAQMAPTPQAAYALLAQRYREDSPLAASLHAALAGQADGEQAAALRLLDAVDNPGDFRVKDTRAIRRLLGERMRLSATTAEGYYRCRFAWYMERVLRARERKKAELSPLESGTFVHYLLEQVVAEAGADFKHCDNAQLQEMTDRHAQVFSAEQLPDDTKRGAWRLEQIKQGAFRLLCFLRDVATQSAFSIDATELEIGGAAHGVPPLRLEGANGTVLELTGKVDRVDVYQEDGKTYLCILDYKTGDKRFSLEEIYCGINMQMIIYMDALCKNNNGRYSNPVPGAVLYLSGDPAPTSGARGGATKPPFKFDGLLLEDDGVIHALAGGSTDLLPVRFNKDGSLRAGSSAATAEVFRNIQEHVENMLIDMVAGVQGGAFPARPLVQGASRPCDYCAYRAACRHEDGLNEQVVSAPADAFAPAAAVPNEAPPQEAKP